MTGKNELDPYETWAEESLTPLLGKLKHTDVPDAPDGTHDFEIDQPNGRVAVIEVTSDVDNRRLSQRAALQKPSHRYVLPGSRLFWSVGLLPSTRLRNVTPTRLSPLLRRIEALGIRSTMELPRTRCSLRDAFRLLGVESAFGHNPKPGSEGLVLIKGGTSCGRSWRSGELDHWLRSIITNERGRSKVAKLARATADDRHLVVVVDQDTAAGFGLRLALGVRNCEGAAEFELPSFRPPEPLTHVWILPMFETEGLLWTPTEGWRIVELTSSRLALVESAG